MRKCPICGMETAVKRFIREEVSENQERHTRIYVCRNRNCNSFEKEAYQTVKTVNIEKNEAPEA